ncbi:hypothetical protein [Methylotenera sp.]|uniref:hypothetical protein n=1 Tax=Methylotenera sp. TaxID=2051956 RepID=UPI002EDA1307
MQLYPVINTGFFVNETGDYTPLKDTGMVCAITFANEGTNSNVTVKFSGGQKTILPGDTLEINAPLYAYDVSTYSYFFTDGGTDEERVDNMQILIQKYADNG